MTTPLDTVLGKLDARPAGEDRWQARCPAHDDRDPSLSIGIGEEGRVLLHCHAGCSTPDVLGALGLAEADLFERRNGDGGREIVAKTPAPPPEPLSSEDEVAGWHRALLDHEGALDRLRALKGWTPATLARFEVGFDGERVTFSIRDASGELLNVGGAV